VVVPVVVPVVMAVAMAASLLLAVAPPWASSVVGDEDPVV